MIFEAVDWRKKCMANAGLRMVVAEVEDQSRMGVVSANYSGGLSI